MFAETYNLYKQKKAVEARLLSYKTHDGDIPNFEKDEVDLFGSEVKTVFRDHSRNESGQNRKTFQLQQS